MEQRNWVVTLTDREGATTTATFNWPRQPTAHDAAIAVRDSLLPNGFLIPDMPRGSGESPAVYLLRSYGFEIESIEESSE